MYSYVRHGLTILPGYEDEHEIGVGTARSTFRPLADGSQLRSYASDRAVLTLPAFRRTARIVEATPEALAVAYDAVRAMVGTVDKLWRRRIDGATHWILAELTEESGSTSHATMFRYGTQFAQDVAVTFTPLGPVWNGAQHGPGIPLIGGDAVQSGITGTQDTDVFALANGSVVVTNGGNAPVDHVLVTAIAGDAPLTALTLTCGRAKWTWTGSVAAGQSLTVDTKAQRVLNNGVAAYGGWVRDAAHTLDAWNWLRLEPGANTITLSGVAGGGAGSTISFAFFDGHI